MNYKYNDDFILRFEFFGGLLYHKFNSTIYNIDFYDLVYLDCIKNNYSDNLARKITSKVFDIDYIPNINNMIDNDILHKTQENKINSINISKILYFYIEKIKQIKKRNYLSSPIEVSIYPSSACQLNCNFCYFKNKRDYYNKYLPKNYWINLINKLKVNDVVYLSILGGEPTLYPYIDYILKHVDKIKMKTTITTNGVYIKESTFNIICNSKYITPTISLQSLGNYNKSSMKIKSDSIVKTIKKFIENGKIPRINSVIYKQSMQDIYDMIDFCHSNNISQYSLNIYMPLGTDVKNVIDFNYYKLMNEKIEEYINMKKYENLDVSIQGCLFYSAYYNELDNPVNNEFDKIIYGCEAGQTKLEIMPNGDVLPCTAFNITDFKYDNVFKEDFMKIWNDSKYLNALRCYKTKDIKCLKCKYSDFCNGGCPAYNIRFNKSLSRKGDERCKVIL